MQHLLTCLHSHQLSRSTVNTGFFGCFFHVTMSVLSARPISSSQSPSLLPSYNIAYPCLSLYMNPWAVKSLSHASLVPFFNTSPFLSHNRRSLLVARSVWCAIPIPNRFPVYSIAYPSLYLTTTGWYAHRLSALNKSAFIIPAVRMGVWRLTTVMFISL